MTTSDHQFAFKAKHSTVMCASILKEIVSYNLKRKTTVYRAVRRLWRIPRNSHRYIVYVLSSMLSLQKQLEKRFLNMFDAMLMSENKLVI